MGPAERLRIVGERIDQAIAVKRRGQPLDRRRVLRPEGQARVSHAEVATAAAITSRSESWERLIIDRELFIGGVSYG